MYNRADKKRIKAEEDESNYSFILKCMAAAGAALVAAGVITAIALAATAKAAAVGVTAGATALAFSPIVPIIGIVTLIIASLCVLPLLFSGNSTTYVSSTPRSSYYGIGGPTMFVPFGFGGSHHHGHHHGHGGGIFGGGGGGGSHHHGHGGGSVFGGGGGSHHHGHR